MNVLITGGAGFIGRNLARLLPKYGHDVYAPSHRYLDLTVFGQLYRAVEEHYTEVIIHTAVAGGTRNVNYEAFKENMEMFENILNLESRRPSLQIINIGSGAEFDVRKPIQNIDEMEFLKRWPVDFYGLAKNLIARRLHAESNGINLRLFGCFGEDEPDDRFIKRSINRLKKGLPIELFCNKHMDFFYINDVATAVDYYIRNPLKGVINLVYPEMETLESISYIIQEEMEVISDILWNFEGGVHPPSYTGNRTLLNETGIQFLGLREGIKRTVQALI